MLSIQNTRIKLLSIHSKYVIFSFITTEVLTAWVAQLIQCLGSGLDNPVWHSWHAQKLFLFSKMSRLALRNTQTAIQWVPRAHSPTVENN